MVTHHCLLLSVVKCTIAYQPCCFSFELPVLQRRLTGWKSLGCWRFQTVVSRDWLQIGCCTKNVLRLLLVASTPLQLPIVWMVDPQIKLCFIAANTIF